MIRMHSHKILTMAKMTDNTKQSLAYHKCGQHTKHNTQIITYAGTLNMTIDHKRKAAMISTTTNHKHKLACQA